MFLYNILYICSFLKILSSVKSGWPFRWQLRVCGGGCAPPTPLDKLLSLPTAAGPTRLAVLSDALVLPPLSLNFPLSPNTSANNVALLCSNSCKELLCPLPTSPTVCLQLPGLSSPVFRKEAPALLRAPAALLLHPPAAHQAVSCLHIGPSCENELLGSRAGLCFVLGSSAPSWCPTSGQTCRELSQMSNEMDS